MICRIFTATLSFGAIIMLNIAIVHMTVQQALSSFRNILGSSLRTSASI